MSNEIKFVFFGGEPLGVPVLEELKKSDLVPQLIVCSPDKPTGRKQTLTAPPVKEWAFENNIEVFQPKDYDDVDVRKRLESKSWDIFVVVAYNFILPSWLLTIPKHQTINLHPSLLPKLRGASPIRSAILNDEPESIGVTIILLDEEMDHGPILDQTHLPISEETWPMSGPELDLALADMGGKLLSSTITDWISGTIEPQEQPHEAATYSKKLTKADSQVQIDLHNLPTGSDARNIYLKIKAFAGIGDVYFLHGEKRVKIKQAEMFGGSLNILRIVPEGKKEMDFKDYLRNIN